MEEWHQKLHNNSSPDDVVICEVYVDKRNEKSVLSIRSYLHIFYIIKSYRTIIAGTFKLCKMWFQNRCLLENFDRKRAYKKRACQL